MNQDVEQSSSPTAVKFARAAQRAVSDRSLRLIRGLYLVGLLVVSYRVASNVEWTYDVRDTGGVGPAIVAYGFLWAPPPNPPYEQFVTPDYRKQFPDSHPGPHVYRTLTGWLQFTWMLNIGVYSVVVGLVYFLVRGRRLDVILDIAFWCGMSLVMFTIGDMFLWGLFPYWVGLCIAAAVGLWVFLFDLLVRRDRFRDRSTHSRHSR